MTAKRASVRKRKKEALAAHPKFADANGGEEHAPILRVKREPRWRIIREAFPKEERLHSLARIKDACVKCIEGEPRLRRRCNQLYILRRGEHVTEDGEVHFATCQVEVRQEQDSRIQMLR